MRRGTLDSGVVPSTGSRLPGIEGLRALAAFSILVFHTWMYSAPSGGFYLGRLNSFMPDLAFGVTLFFTLSGFLLYRPFASALLRGSPTPSIGAYLRNRALRILPAYWAILLLTSLVLQSALSRTGQGQLHNGALVDVGVLARSALFLQDYDPHTTLAGIGPAWSLAVEVVFYLALPLLVLATAALASRCATQATRRAAVLAPAAFLLVLGLSGKAAAAFLVPPVAPFAGWEADWHSVIERSFWCHADLFAFGMALAVVRTEYVDGRLRLPAWWRKAALLLIVGGYAVTARATTSTEQLSYSPFNTLVALVCALVVGLVVLTPAAGRPPRFLRLLETRPFVAAGIISYSVFLWHEPLIRWLQGHHLTADGRAGFVLNLAVATAVTAALSALTYRYVEYPALRLKRGGRGRPKAAAPMPQEQLEAAP